MPLHIFCAIVFFLILLLYPQIQYSNQDEYGELVREVKLLEQEIEGRSQRRVERLQKYSHLPAGKTLAALNQIKKKGEKELVRD